LFEKQEVKYPGQKFTFQQTCNSRECVSRLGIYVQLCSTVCTKFTTFAKEGMFHPASVGLLEG